MRCIESVVSITSPLILMYDAVKRHINEYTTQEIATLFRADSRNKQLGGQSIYIFLPPNHHGAIWSESAHIPFVADKVHQSSQLKSFGFNGLVKWH